MLQLDIAKEHIAYRKFWHGIVMGSDISLFG